MKNKLVLIGLLVSGLGFSQSREEVFEYVGDVYNLCGLKLGEAASKMPHMQKCWVTKEGSLNFAACPARFGSLWFDDDKLTFILLQRTQIKLDPCSEGAARTFEASLTPEEQRQYLNFFTLQWAEAKRIRAREKGEAQRQLAEEQGRNPNAEAAGAFIGAIINKVLW